MKFLIVTATLLISLGGCGVSGMGSMNGMPNMGSTGFTGSSQADEDAATQARIKHGEEVENEEARKAGFGPSPTEGMNCSTTTSYTGSANAGTSTSHTSCHN